jgi:hypothetical protein
MRYNITLQIKSWCRRDSYGQWVRCDSEFEGELAWYSPAFDIIDKLLDAAGDAVIEFLSIPIKIVQFVLQAASNFLPT